MADSLPAQERLGPEFRVNEDTPFNQVSPSVAMTPAGDFVVGWVDFRHGYPSGYGANFRRFDAWGQPTAPETPIAGTYAGSVDRLLGTTVAVAPSGSFVVAWNKPDGASVAHFRDASDVPAGSPLEIAGALPRAASAGPSSFVITWGASGHVARRVDLTGAPLGSDVALASSSMNAAVVAGDPSGGFVAVWSKPLDQQVFSDKVMLRRYDASAAPLGPEMQANAYTSGFPTWPSVAADAAGNFVVVWMQIAAFPDDDRGIFAQRYDATGAALGGNFKVSTTTTLYPSLPTVACDGNGQFMVVWAEAQNAVAVGPADVVARRYDASGAPLGPEFIVNAYTTGRQFYPRVAGAGDGRFVVVWQNDEAADMSPDIHGQMFLDGNLIFADGFESGTHAAWSASGTGAGSLSVGANDMPGGGAWSLEATVTAPGGAYVEDQSPADEPEYHARFLFDPNGFDPGESASHFRVRIFLGFDGGARRSLALVLRRQGGAYAIRGRARLDDSTQADTPFVPITDQPHAVEIAWRRSRDADANDGSFELWIDGTSAGVLSGLDNATRTVDFVRLGALAVKPGAAGSMRWDRFESRRRGSIGP